MQPFTQVHNFKTFITFAADTDGAREKFVGHGLPDPGRIRAQPSRKASAFKYTLYGETVAATVVGEVPVEFRDDEPTVSDDPAPEDTAVDSTVLDFE